MAQLRKVTMDLSERDVKNTEMLTEQFHTRNKAEAVSAALSITAFLSERLQGDKELIIRDKKGDIEKIIIPGLTENE